MVLEWKDRTIYIDPYGGAERFKNFKKPDIVVITHAHGDHFNKETLKGLDLSSAELIAPQSVVDELGDISFNEVTVVSNTGGVVRYDIRIEGMPMYNLPDDETSRHKKGWGNGYVIHIGGKSFYISGDTEDIIEMRLLQNIDCAFVCMNQPYTMTVEQAADAVLEFKPKVVYPFHYRGQDGFSDVEKFKELVGADPGIEVRLRNWYPE
jgi:L-ascorbate metabolism protein UlaG (beta-lactamase superfamily)